MHRNRSAYLLGPNVGKLAKTFLLLRRFNNARYLWDEFLDHKFVRYQLQFIPPSLNIVPQSDSLALCASTTPRFHDTGFQLPDVVPAMQVWPLRGECGKQTPKGLCTFT